MKGNIKIQLPFWFITIFAVVIFSVFFRKLSQNALYNNLIVVVLTLSLLAILAMLFYKAFKITAENNEKQKEFERKKEWEEFQYNLHKEERAEKQRYDTIKAFIEKLDDKEPPKEIPLKEEVEKLKTDLTELKKEKDKKYFVEIVNSLKSKK